MILAIFCPYSKINWYYAVLVITLEMWTLPPFQTSHMTFSTKKCEIESVFFVILFVFDISLHSFIASKFFPFIKVMLWTKHRIFYLLMTLAWRFSDIPDTLVHADTQKNTTHQECLDNARGFFPCWNCAAWSNCNKGQHRVTALWSQKVYKI